MARKKIEIVNEVDSEIKLELAKDCRRRMYNLKAIQSNENSRQEFKKFFIKLKKWFSLDNDMENILWLHLVAIKCDSKEKFNEGLKNFGLNIQQ
jgi:hypothetical protein